MVEGTLGRAPLRGLEPRRGSGLLEDAPAGGPDFLLAEVRRHFCDELIELRKALLLDLRWLFNEIESQQKMLFERHEDVFHRTLEAAHGFPLEKIRPDPALTLSGRPHGY